MATRSSTAASPPRGRIGPAVRLLATGLGIGYVPWAPGTAGSLLGIALCLPLRSLSEPVYFGAALCLTAVAVWVAGRTAAEFGQADPQPVIIDEIVGMLWAAIALPPSLYDLTAVFLLFRIFDGVKPAPISWLERVPGGAGIVADDVVAGLLARIVWWLLKVNFDFL